MKRILHASMAALLASPTLYAQVTCPSPLPPGLQCPAPIHLDKIDDDYSAPLDYTYEYLYTGTGVDVYILDMGVASIPDLPNLQTASYDAFPGVPFNGHGTNVAAIVGGVNTGVAKGVRLYSVRVSGGAVSAVAAGIDWAIAKSAMQKIPRRAVINISLDYRSLMSDSVIRQKIEQAINQGIVVVAATGNNDLAGGNSVTNACTGLPEIPLLYVVGNANIGGMGTSSRGGPCVDGYAPDAHVLGTGFQRSSASAPQFAGIAALVLEQFPTLSVAGVHAELNKRATKGKIHPSGSTGAWIPGSWDRLAYSLPVYFNAPTAMTSISVDNMQCENEHIVSWSGGGASAAYYELQSSSTLSFAAPFTQVFEDTITSVYPTTSTYYRVRACNGYGCGAYATRTTPANPYPGCS